MKKSILLALLVLAACSRQQPEGMAGEPINKVAERKLTDAEIAAGNKGGDQATRRYLALKHEVKLLVPATTLARHFSAIQAECIKLGCEILSARQVTEGEQKYAFATLSARVPSAAFAGFFTGIQSHGKLASHQSESEDKTAEVIDVEARIKNLEALKARVLELLAKHTGSLKDVLEAERSLAETQATLDSMRGQRRVLASQTDMVKLDIELRPQSLVNENSWTAPVVVAAGEAGEVLMKSVAFLLTVSVALLPWGLVLAAVFVVLRRMWRKRRARKLASADAIDSHRQAQ